MIKTFKDKDLQKLFQRKYSKCPEKLHKRLRNRLYLMDTAVTKDDFAAIPGGCLEELGGDRQGQLSLRVSGNWRICFVWDGADAHDVELVDYH
jgi:proteic killer suppression protein